MRISPARKVAREIVSRVRERSAYAHETLDAVLAAHPFLDDRDRGLATRIAYGTIACRGTLDEAIARYLRGGAGLEPLVSDCLACGAFEVLYMRTPPHAVVSQTVESVRVVSPRASGLANAVMRRLAESAQEFPWGDPACDIDALARLHGHPVWLARTWVRELGAERASEVMAANNEPAPLFLAHLAQTDLGWNEAIEELNAVGAEPVAGPVKGSILCGHPALARKAESVSKRLLPVIDAGAQFAVSALEVSPGDAVIEIGAGRGTKSLLAASAARRAVGVESPPAKARASVLAVDLHEHKLAQLRSDAARVGYTEISTLVADATDFDLAARLGTQVDKVLVDAPCSGLGTLRRHPDRRWRATPSDVGALADLSARLLLAASGLLKPAGTLVYSTCTITNAENHDVISSFLESPTGAAFQLDSLEEIVPPEWHDWLTASGTFQSYPTTGGCDGHYVARLKRI